MEISTLFRLFDSFFDSVFNFLGPGAGGRWELIFNSVSNFGPEGPKNSSGGIEGSQGYSNFLYLVVAVERGEVSEEVARRVGLTYLDSKTLKTHTPQIWVVKISPPKFREWSPESTVKQVLFEDSPPKFGG